jgi:hypothetical protein
MNANKRECSTFLICVYSRPFAVKDDSPMNPGKEAQRSDVMMLLHNSISKTALEECFFIPPFLLSLFTTRRPNIGFARCVVRQAGPGKQH